MKDKRELVLEFEEACEACRELVVDSLAESLQGSLQPHVTLSWPQATGAAEKIFARFKSMVSLTLKNSGDPRNQATIDHVLAKHRAKRGH